jgi:class 3 adenylate cyclase
MHPLGLGVGVASGNVTVGAIAAATRMEYTAIGMPVNLAARLCAAAGSDEVLIDAEAAQLSKVANLRSSHEMKIKGFSDVQLVYALDTGPPTG